MRITGTQHTVGTIHICENYRSDAPVELTEVQGILISTGDKETHEAMCNLISSTVDIYPHPVNGLVAGECTPENYAHALARLAHAEDHLAREVRSSQALLSARSNQARDAAWSEYLDIRKQIRKVAAEGRTDSEEQRTLVARALDLARLHNFDPPTRELEKLQAEHDALAGIAHDLRIKLVEAESLAAGVRREAAAWLRSLDAPPYFYGLSYETIARCIESGLDPKVIARETA